VDKTASHYFIAWLHSILDWKLSKGAAFKGQGYQGQVNVHGQAQNSNSLHGNMKLLYLLVQEKGERQIL